IVGVLHLHPSADGRASAELAVIAERCGNGRVAGIDIARFENDVLEPRAEIQMVDRAECNLRSQVTARAILLAANGQEVASGSNEHWRRRSSRYSWNIRNADDPRVQLAAFVKGRVQVGKERNRLADPGVVASIDVK